MNGKWIKIFVLSITLLGCGRQPAINADLRGSVERYLDHAKSHGHIDDLVSVDWGDVPGTALGICDVKPAFHGHSRKIRILRREYAPSVLDALVAHELGHCLNDKKHDDSRMPALMNSQLIETVEFWDENLNAEIERL